MFRIFCCMCVCSIVASGMYAADAPEHPLKFGGRFIYDVAMFDSDDVDINDGGEVRYARMYVKGDLENDWFFKIQYELTGDGREGIRDAYLGYSGVSFLDSIRIGNFTEYGSIEDTTSSKYTVFMSRSMPIEAFVPAARRLGIGADAHGKGWYAGAGIFGEGAEVDKSEEDGTGISGRFAWIPIREDRAAVHLGVFGQLRTPRSGNTVRYRSRPEAHVSNQRLLDTGVISNVNHTVMYGLEALWICGAVSLQGEYLGNTVDRDEFSSESYGGYYVSSCWFLTGESLAYDAEGGYLGKIKPLKPLGDGGIGAVALACRFSTLDLDDSILGGTEDNITVGLNWHPTANTRFMLNYVNAQASVAGVDATVDLVQLRTQLIF